MNKLQKLISGALATLAAVTMTIVIATSRDGASLLRADTAQTECVSSIYFGEIEYTAEKYSSSAMPEDSDISVQSHKVFASVLSGSNVYNHNSTATEIGIKLGSSKKIGDITITFNTSITFNSITMYINKKCTQSSTSFTINDNTYTCKTSNYNFEDVSGNNAKGYCTYNFDSYLTTQSLLISGKQLCLSYISLY